MSPIGGEKASGWMHTVVSSVFGRQFSNMLARVASFMRLLMSEMAASIAGETNFLSDGGGLAQREGERKTRRMTSRGNERAAVIVPAVRFVLEVRQGFFDRGADASKDGAGKVSRA